MEATNYYWDDWQCEAIEQGVGVELAALGRQLMREMYQHGHDPLIALGTEDDGPYMLVLCLRAPITAEVRFGSDLASYSWRPTSTRWTRSCKATSPTASSVRERMWKNC